MAACSGVGDNAQGDAKAGQPQDLEAVAVERGLVRDPDDRDLAGLYARDTDRLCIVPDGDAYRIGAFVDYGDRNGCSGQGTVTRTGGALKVELRAPGGRVCAFEAKLDGERIDFPAALPDGCAALCSGRASFSALEAERISGSTSEARALRDPRGKAVCGG
ncbi:hypothetical protein DMC47_18365 [Nostoc sp. 3335mG]|nr:hypothetical protein DMC47_18365 [Nostoc sp. 3335mG]